MLTQVRGGLDQPDQKKVAKTATGDQLVQLNFPHRSLYRANLMGADLRGVVLKDADLRGANLPALFPGAGRSADGD